MVACVDLVRVMMPAAVVAVADSGAVSLTLVAVAGMSTDMSTGMITAMDAAMDAVVSSATRVVTLAAPTTVVVAVAARASAIAIAIAIAADVSAAADVLSAASSHCKHLVNRATRGVAILDHGLEQQHCAVRDVGREVRVQDADCELRLVCASARCGLLFLL